MNGSLRRLWVGTYPEAGPSTPVGLGEGVWEVMLDTATGSLSAAVKLATTPSPSYLAAGRAFGDLLYAVNESREGGLTVLRVGPDGLEPVASASTQGAHPCHLHVDRRRGVAVVANYTSGSVSVFRLRADGLPEQDHPDQVFQFSGSGPNQERQEASHAHFVLATSAGDMLLVSDLGSDRIHRFTVDGERRRLIEQGVAVTLPPGSGPRHTAFSPDGRQLFVTGELDGRLHVVDWDQWNGRGTVSYSTPADPGTESVPQLAHIERAGSELYLGCRGTDRIAVHRIEPGGAVRFVHAIPLPGATPRHHTVVDGWLLVAQLERGGVVAMDRSGTVRGSAAIPSPACVLPA